MSMIWLDAGYSRARRSRIGRKCSVCSSPKTQLINRGKVPNPIEFGHRVLVVEDGAGFVCYYAILPHGVEDRAVAVETMKQVQNRFKGQVRSASIRSGVPYSRESESN